VASSRPDEAQLPFAAAIEIAFSLDFLQYQRLQCTCYYICDWK